MRLFYSLRLPVTGALLAHAVAGFNFDMGSYMRIQAMKQQFDTDSIGNEQQNALMNVAGFSDMELYLSKQISPDQFKQSLKQKMKDQMITDIMNSGGIDISNPLWRRKFFADKTDAELFTETMPEPMQSIVRLTKANEPELKEYGQSLLKKFQYAKFNKQGNIMTENMDEIMLSDNKSETIKNLLKQQMLNQIADPLDRAMMHNMQKQQTSTDSQEKLKLKEDLKDLQTVKLFQGHVPKVSPVNSDDLYAFYKLTNEELNESEILNHALGDSLNGISDLDFERYFGSSAKQFSCRSHPNRLRVPCGVNPSADECLASGCCYNPTAIEGVPSCYSDIYGKIGSSILREAFVEGEASRKDQISSLFKNGKLPNLTTLLKDDLNQYLEEPMQVYEKNEEKHWWDAAAVEGKTEDRNLLFPEQQRTGYGRPGFQWTPHGPTASPFIDRFPGVNPTAIPGSDESHLDTYYQMWLDYTDTQDQANCALIPPEGRVKCMENFEALTDYKQGTNLCGNAGCCFNEEAFLKGQHACYRASDYGTCTNLPHKFVKKECGYDGIGEMQCLSNARCCYQPTHKADEPWCYFKYSATLEEDEWCEAWNLVENRQKERKPCWENKTTQKNLFDNQGDVNAMTNINNLVTQDQCLKAGCCYDSELSKDALDWITNGLGQTNIKYRCFAKENPALYKKVNHSEGKVANEDYVNPETLMTCSVADWSDPNTIKKSCGEDLSYYQCVYVNKCCYKATLTNEPNCFRPEERK